MKKKAAILSAFALAMALTSCDVFGGPDDPNKRNFQEDTQSVYEYTAKDILYYTQAGDVICNLRSGNKTRTIKKSYDGFCAVALANIGDYFGPVLVGEDRVQVCYETDGDNPSYSTSYGTIEYQGKTYYYSKAELFLSGKLTGKEQYSNYFSKYETVEEVAKDIASKATFNPVPEEAKKKFLFKELDDGTLSVYAGPYLMEEKAIVIPASFNGKKVSTIKTKGFKGLKSLEKLSFESGSVIKTIESNAFSNCSNLRRVVIPENIKNIGDYTFTGCSDDLMIFCEAESRPAGYFVSSGYPYENWYGSADKVWWGTKGYFEDDSYLYGLKINDKLLICKYFKNEENVSIPKEYEGKTIDEIGRFAFYEKKGIINLTLPESLHIIGESAFYSCTLLSKIAFPVGLVSLDSHCFQGSSSLKFVTIPDTVKYVGSYCFSQCNDELMIYCEAETRPAGYFVSSGYPYENWYGSADKVWWGMTDYIIDGDFIYGVKLDGTLSISKYVGNDKDVIIPSSYGGKAVTSIGTSAFEGKNRILSISIPNTIQAIRSSAFKGCSQLSVVKIPASVTSIDDYAFEKCSELKFVTIPDTVKYVGSYCFSQCNDELMIYCEAETRPAGYFVSSGYPYENWYGSADKVWWGMTDYIIDGDFIYGVKLDDTLAINLYTGNKTSVSIPFNIGNKTIKEISPQAFSGKNKIKEIEMKFNITKIGEKAFYGCTLLQNVELSSSLESIGRLAFCGCSNLPYIVIPKSVTTIEFRAFYNENTDFVIYCEATSKPDGFYHNRYGPSNEDWNGGYTYYFRPSWAFVDDVPTKVV